MRSHLVAVPQTSPQQWIDTFPCPIERLPEVVQVVLIRTASTMDEVRRAASSARALRVNGQYTLMWMHHLAPIYARHFLDVHMDKGALRAYASIDGVPESIVRSACVALDDIEADEILQVRGALPHMGRDSR